MLDSLDTDSDDSLDGERWVGEKEAGNGRVIATATRSDDAGERVDTTGRNLWLASWFYSDIEFFFILKHWKTVVIKTK